METVLEKKGWSDTVASDPNDLASNQLQSEERVKTGLNGYLYKMTMGLDGQCIPHRVSDYFWKNLQTHGLGGMECQGSRYFLSPRLKEGNRHLEEVYETRLTSFY